MNKQARDKIFKENIGLVYKVALSKFKRFKKTDIWDDLIQEGMTELYRSTGSYEGDRGIAFSTFAYNNIYFRILKYVETFVYQKQIVNKVVGERKYKQSYEGAKILELDKPYNNGSKPGTEKTTLADYLEDEFNGFEEVENKIFVDNVVQFAKTLENTSTRKVFRGIHKIMVLRVEGLTSYEIGKELKVSKTAVLNKLNKFYEYYRENFYIA